MKIHAPVLNSIANPVIVFFLISTFLLATLFLAVPWQYFLISFFIFILFVLFLIRPVWGLYSLIFIIPILSNQAGFQIDDYSWARNNLFPVFSIILAVNILLAGMLRSARIRVPSAPANPLAVLILLFLAYGVFSLYWSPNFAFSLIVTASLVINALLFSFVFSMISDSTYHKRCMGFFIVSGIAVATLTVISIIHHPQYKLAENLIGPLQFSLFYNPKVGLRGYAIEHPNFTSLFLNLSIASSFGMYLVTDNKLFKKLLLPVLIYLIFANALTFSKGGLGSMLIMGLFIIIFSSDLRKRLFMNLSLFIALFILVWFASSSFASQFGNLVRKDIFGLTPEGIATVSFSTRLEMWAEGFNAVFEKMRFIYGLGPGGFSFYTKRLWSHNLLLSFFFDFGLVGLLFFIGILVLIGKRLYRLKKYLVVQNNYFQKMTLALCGGLIAIGIHGLVDFYYNQSIHWLYLALTLSAITLSLESVSGEDTTQ